MPKSTLAGHPLHPMLIVAPGGLVGAFALTAANVAMRREGYKHTGGSLALSALAAVGVIVSGWFGGRMVYEQGMRVKDVSPIKDAPEAKLLPGDERIERGLRHVEEFVPSSGPLLH